jgi:hypothetical protein
MYDDAVAEGSLQALVTREALAATGVFALVAALGFDAGGYAPTAWGWSAVVLFAVLTLLLWRGGGRPGRLALVFVGTLAAATAWTATSILWSSDVAASVLEVERGLVYLGAAAVFVLAGSAQGLLAGALGGAALVSAVGLWRWLVGDPTVLLSADPEAGERLSDPIGYANGVGILAAMGFLLATGFAARASRLPAVAAGAAAAPLFATTLYFTFSRGAWLALAAGLVVAAAVGPRRLQLAAVVAAVALPSSLAVLAADRLGASAAVAGLLPLVCALTAAGALAVRRAEPASRPSPRLRRGFAVVLVALPVVAAAAVLVRLGGPGGVLESFESQPAAAHTDVRGRLFSVAGSSRADYWRVAGGMVEDDAALGAGAGTFTRVWLRERPVPQPARDAHSLYLETLAELGPLGLVSLAVAFGTPFAARRSRWTPVALAPYSAFLLHAGQDWDWELPAVTVAALACAAAPLAAPGRRRLPRAGAALAAALCAVAAFGYLGNRALAEATAAAERAATSDAREAARTARTLQPWSPEPWRLLGEAQLAEGELATARRSFRRGLDIDPAHWELWLDLGLASDGTARSRAFARAAMLNPLSPELRELGVTGR